MYAGSSLAKSFYPRPYDHEYRVERRVAPRQRQRERSAPTTPRPLIQQYWHNLVRNIPTLPPLRWNISNPLGNIFAAGAQQIIETPVALPQSTERPSRIRRVNRRRNTKTKKSKKILHSDRRGYYDGSYHTHQLQLQPLGVDTNGVMHLYDPSTRQFYALQIESRLSYYNQHSQYNTYNDYDDEDDSDDTYHPHTGYENEENGYDGQDSGYEENDYDSDGQEYDVNNDYDNYEPDDNVEVVDNWGYNDEEIFADRKLKGGEMNNLAGSFIRIQKHLLMPETENDALHQLSNAQRPTIDSAKQKPRKEVVEKNNNELGRNAWNTVLYNAVNKSRRQPVKQTKTFTKSINRPRLRQNNIVFTPILYSLEE